MAKAKRRKSDDTTPPDDGDESGRQKSKPSGKAGRLRVSMLVANLFAVLVWAGLGMAAVTIYFILDLPPIDEAALTRRPNIKVLDAGDWEVASFGDIYGASINLRELPAYVPAAVVAVEDRRFYQHPGVDVRALARALYRGVSEDIPAGNRMEGGSTITQQVAKNLFLTSERTVSRKIKEALVALKLERMYTKDQLLTLYMNRMYFGGGVYGFEGASERYFGRPAKDLTVFQAALLTGMLKAPSHYNPAREPDRAKDRAEIVIGTMVETGALTPEQAKAALKGADRALKAVVNPTARARHFADWVVAQVESYVGRTDEDLIVHTTLDGRLQAQAETALTKHLDASGAKQRVEEGAVVVLGTDGAVRAMVGGRDYSDSQFNRATQAMRQPGSAFKPFVYLAGIEAGYRPDDMITDAPLKIGKWKPQNFSGTYEGPVSIETAFAKSLNTAAVRVAQHAGPKAVLAVAHRLGITEKLTPELSLALGSNEVTLLELTGAYAPFANGGSAVMPYAITSITDRAGKVLYQRDSGGLGQVITPENVAVMNHMMSEVITRGTGTAAAFGYPAAGKTGTSSDFRDAWFMGFTADYVTGVWMGNDSGAGMKGVTGGGLPARVWRDVMTAAHTGHAPRDLPGMEPPASRDLISRFWQAITGSGP
jgi:penicillin-binding protein 1A